MSKTGTDPVVAGLRDRRDWEEVPDDQLAIQAVSDLDAFAEIVRRHQGFVYGAALRVVRNPAIAEEVAQEAFIRAHRALGSFRGDSALRSWLYRIATNLAKNAAARSREDPTDLVLEQVDLREPGHTVEAKAMSEDLEEAIRRLPEHLRVPLVMREFEHKSYQEIADRAGLRLNTVRTRILRARRALRKEMEDWR